MSTGLDGDANRGVGPGFRGRRILNGPDDTWAHALSRLAVPPLLATPVRPNHVTALRLVTGLFACIPLASGAPGGAIAFGVIWTFSGLLDRLDGELARIGNMRSRTGHLFDYYSDLIVDSVVFLAIGAALSHGRFGGWAMLLGVDACLCMGLCMWLSEVFEARQGGERIWGAAWRGFHPDDALFLLAPFAWLGWLPPVLVAAAASMTAILVVILVRLARQRRRPASVPH